MQSPESPNSNSIDKEVVANVDTMSANASLVLYALKFEGLDSDGFKAAKKKYFDDLDAKALSQYPNDPGANVEADIKKIELYVEIRKRIPSAYGLGYLLDMIEGAIDSAKQQSVADDILVHLDDIWNEVNKMGKGENSKLPNLEEK